MAQQTIAVGAAANDGTGDPLRTAMQKTNANFTELYSGTGVPKARGFLTTADFSAPTGFSKVPLNAETFDVGGYFDTTTNRRYTPLVAGYYQVNAMIHFDPGTIATSVDFAALIYKNGSVAAQFEGRGTINNGIIAAACSDIILMNGSTDYLELFFYHNSAAARNVKAGTNLTYLSAALIR